MRHIFLLLALLGFVAKIAVDQGHIGGSKSKTYQDTILLAPTTTTSSR